MADRKSDEEPERTGRGAREPGGRRERKDRLIQTRVPRDLEATLKEEARRQRLTVSHLIRNILEDTFQLVDGVVSNVDRIVTDSVELARTVGREAKRLSEPRARSGPAPEPADDLAHVVAWTEAVAHLEAHCSRCRAVIAPGDHGFTGLSDQRGATRVWLCPDCIGSLARP